MRKFRHVSLLVSLLYVQASWCADSPWQTARIVDVRTATNSRNTVWVVNTPITDEETECLIRIHFKDKIFQGSYVLGKSQASPPPEWVKHTPVRVQFVGDTMFLKAPEGIDYKLHVTSTKPAHMMDPLTPEEIAAEKAAAAREQEPPESMIGFDTPEPPAKQPAAQAQPVASPEPPPEPTKGTVAISSMPYLAEVFVDGESIGYTPAKLHLPPGKHAFRCEKSGYRPWTKEITVTTGSEQTLDATLEMERK
jgi:PEGA domain